MPNSFLNRVFRAGSSTLAFIAALVVLAVPVVLVVPAMPASAAMCQGCVVVSAPTIGHRTSYGGVFNLVPSLMPGDPVSLIDDNGVHQYAVSRLLIVTESGWQNEINIYDASRPRLILQPAIPTEICVT